jgi:hypothetical protein
VKISGFVLAVRRKATAKRKGPHETSCGPVVQFNSNGSLGKVSH